MRYSRTRWQMQLALAGGLVLLLALGALIFWMVKGDESVPEVVEVVEEVVVPDPRESSLGQSVEGRDIESFTFGEGDTKLLFVGGIHGGYEWNSVYLMHRYIDYLIENPNALPEGIELTIVPVMNPDGLYKVVGTTGRFDPQLTPSVKETEVGRFNARDVDLNRNFDCKWQPTSTWRGVEVSAGTSAFSEPETRALRDWVLMHNPQAVIFWHSQANAVYASECLEGVLPETKQILDLYAEASGYPAFESFDHYEITGDAGDWLATQGIPSLSIELKTHETIEWEKDLAGIEALLEYYENQ